VSPGIHDAATVAADSTDITVSEREQSAPVSPQGDFARSVAEA
jgi:hypothetical protein